MATGHRGGGETATLTAMADQPTSPRRPADRIKTIAQAALNADVAVEQVGTLLEGVGETLAGLNTTIGGMDGTMKYFEETLVVFNSTLAKIDELAPRLAAVVTRMEAIVTRLERVVGVSEVITAPLAATESAVRGLIDAIKRGK